MRNLSERLSGLLLPAAAALCLSGPLDARVAGQTKATSSVTVSGQVFIADKGADGNPRNLRPVTTPGDARIIVCCWQPRRIAPGPKGVFSFKLNVVGNHQLELELKGSLSGYRQAKMTEVTVPNNKTQIEVSQPDISLY